MYVALQQYACDDLCDDACDDALGLNGIKVL